MRVTKRIREEYETLLKDVGEARFYSHVFGTGVLALRHFEHPENMMLDQSEAFFVLFRTTGNRNYFTIGRILRRAAHRLYRDGKRKNPEYPTNARFLASVK
jgi:hypothetical protein